MKIDTLGLDDNSLIEAEVVIIGGGMAGLTLANQLADAGQDVVVLESGGEELESRVQALYRGKGTLKVPGRDSQDMDAYLVDSRFRYLGGSGNLWGGVCAPLDPSDFLQRSWVPNSGWPFTLEDLQPFYNRACDFLEIPQFFTSSNIQSDLAPPLRINNEQRIRSRPHYVSKYRGESEDNNYRSLVNEISERNNIRVYLNANVTNINLSNSAESVEQLTIKCLNGRRHAAIARNYVLASGGMENVRILLASNNILTNGIGNHSDWLGRAFQGHALIVNGTSEAFYLNTQDSNMALLTDERSPARVSYELGTTLLAQEESRSGNFSIYSRGPRNAELESAAVFGLAAKLAGESSVVRTVVFPLFAIEQSPNRNSRIVLDSEAPLDELGVPGLALNWEFNEFDRDSFERALKSVVKELGVHSAGRIKWDSKPEENMNHHRTGARHHMGATRMAVDPDEGVVDENCKVHGVSNLHIAGSSVFPTSGVANPTLTILALALRLGDHLIADSRRSA